MINIVCGIRSTGRICTDLASELEAQGHEVKIAYGRCEVAEKFQKFAVKIGSDFDVKLHAIKARLFDACGFGSKNATKKFIAWVKNFNPDVIHIHNIHGYYVNTEILFDYLRTCGKKIIWTLHDCWAFTGHTAYCDAVNCEKFTTGCGKCPGLKNYPKSFIDRSASNWIKKKKIFCGIPNMTIITPSNWLAGLVKKSFLSEYPVKVIHNGIDTSKFFPMENDFRDFYGIKNKFLLLGVATAWDEMKGLSDYIKLAEKLDENYKIVLVGLTKKQIEDLPKNILGIERTNSVKELAYIYSAADLYINLSYCENYPTVNLEVLACGTPVLAYDSGGSSESSLNGIIIPRGDIKKAAEEIKTYSENHAGKPEVLFERTEFDNKNTLSQYLDTVSHGGVGYWRYKNSLGLIGKKIILGVSALWEKRKGLDDIIKLSNLLTDAKFILVGLNEAQKKFLPADITAYSRTNNVEELRKLYAAADFYINTTYEDNYPTTNLEAIACRTAVITYDTGGSPESANIYGWTVPKGRIDLIASLIKNNNFPSKIGNVMTLDEMMKEYSVLY